MSGGRSVWWTVTCKEAFKLYPHDATKAERGARAAVIGAVAGIIPAIGLDCVRVLNSEPPEVAAQLAGTIAFALVYASPYLLALMASRARDPGVRGGLLAAIGLLSLVASFSDMSLVSVVLLPATLVLWFAAARSLSASGRPLATSVPAAGRAAHHRDRGARHLCTLGYPRRRGPMLGPVL